jgi:hypothetical protein
LISSNGQAVPDVKRYCPFRTSLLVRQAQPDLQRLWERGWSCLLTTLKSLGPEDLEQTVTIRGEPHSVPLALARSLAHTCYHIGQIVQVARIHAGEHWNTLTIPRGGSAQFNQDNGGQPGKSHA